MADPIEAPAATARDAPTVLPDPRPQPTLGELMVLIAATAVGLAAFQGIRGMEVHVGSWLRSDYVPMQTRFRSQPSGIAASLDRAALLVNATAVSVLGAWSLAVMTIGVGRRRRRFATGLGPGESACLAASVGVVSCVLLQVPLIEFVARSAPFGPDAAMHELQMVVLLGVRRLPTTVAAVVAGAWAVQWASGRRRIGPGWLDRFGTFIGFAWIVAAVVISALGWTPTIL